jgi:hypothetical protein
MFKRYPPVPRTKPVFYPNVRFGNQECAWTELDRKWELREPKKYKRRRSKCRLPLSQDTCELYC